MPDFAVSSRLYYLLYSGAVQDLWSTAVAGCHSDLHALYADKVLAEEAVSGSHRNVDILPMDRRSIGSFF